MFEWLGLIKSIKLSKLLKRFIRLEKRLTHEYFLQNSISGQENRQLGSSP